MTTARKQLKGQLQKPGQRTETVSITVDDSESLNYRIRHRNVSSASGTLSLDISTANSFACTLTENITTIDVNGAMVTDQYWEFNLRLVQHASAAKTVAWAAKFHFPNGVDHVMSTAVDSVDSIHGYSVDGGTIWDCTFALASA